MEINDHLDKINQQWVHKVEFDLKGVVISSVFEKAINDLEEKLPNFIMPNDEYKPETWLTHLNGDIYINGKIAFKNAK